MASGAPIPTPEFLQLSSQVFSYNSETLGFVADITDATGFVISGSQLEILANGNLSNDDEPSSTEPLFFNSAATISAYGFIPVIVTIGQDLSVALVNEENGNSIIEDCGGLVNIGATAGGTDQFGDSCQVIGLTIMPL